LQFGPARLARTNAWNNPILQHDNKGAQQHQPLIPKKFLPFSGDSIKRECAPYRHTQGINPAKAGLP
jgi:hypothetical protein